MTTELTENESVLMHTLCAVLNVFANADPELRDRIVDKAARAVDPDDVEMVIFSAILAANCILCLMEDKNHVSINNVSPNADESLEFCVGVS